VLDCKVESCQRITKDAPLITDYLCDDCKSHFEELQKYLDIMGYDYIIDPRIVRGLDYYTKTAFEIISKDIGAQGTVCGGGRYDGLIEECGGPSMPGVGFGMGLERLLITLEQNGIEIPKPEGVDLFIAYVGEEAKLFTFALANKLRFNGLKVERDNMDRSLKAQMKYANKLNAKFAIVIGEEEMKENKVKLKDMRVGSEVEISIDEIEQRIKNI
jgi:histidyl-tRNA synthetase